MSSLHGGEIEWVVSEQYGLPMSKIISFANTVSPIIPKEATRLNSRFHELYLYPPREPNKVKKAIAEFEGVNPENVILGSGSTELIYLFSRIFGHGDVIIPFPTYSEYEIAVGTEGGRAVFIPPREKLELDVEKILQAMTSKTKAVMICNPNNPTGRLFRQEEILTIATEAERKGAVLFLDEVYMCFAPPEKAYTLAELVDGHSIFILNSISKLFGVPSLRLGWGVASKHTVSKMNKLKYPGTISNVSIWAAENMLADSSYQRKINSYISRQKKDFFRALSRSGVLRPFPSDCNFILSEVISKDWDSTRLFQTLAKRGIVIRDCSSIRGLGDRFVRTTVRSRRHNSRLISALERVTA